MAPARESTGVEANKGKPVSNMLDRIIHYFDLASSARDTQARGHSATRQPAVLPQYLAVCLGVILEPFLRAYMTTGEWGTNAPGLVGRIAFGLIVGIVILPGVYKNSFDPDKPVIVQLAALFPLGVGWQSMFQSAIKLAAG